MTGVCYHLENRHHHFRKYHWKTHIKQHIDCYRWPGHFHRLVNLQTHFFLNDKHFRIHLLYLFLFFDLKMWNYRDNWMTVILAKLWHRFDFFRPTNVHVFFITNFCFVLPPFPFKLCIFRFSKIVTIGPTLRIHVGSFLKNILVWVLLPLNICL